MQVRCNSSLAPNSIAQLNVAQHAADQLLTGLAIGG